MTEPTMDFGDPEHIKNLRADLSDIQRARTWEATWIDAAAEEIAEEVREMHPLNFDFKAELIAAILRRPRGWEGGIMTDHLSALHAARAALSRIADPKLQPIYDLIHDAINGDPLPTRFGPQIDQIMRDRQEGTIDLAEAYTRALMVAALADAALGRRHPN